MLITEEGFMTGRDRILRTFKGEKTDRVPACPWIYDNLVYRYFDIPPEKQPYRVGKYDLVEKLIEVTDYYGFDHMHRLGAPKHQYDEKSSYDGKWTVETDFQKINGRDTEITIIKTPERKLRQVKEFDQTSRYTYVEAITEHYIKDKEDFNQFLKYQPSFGDSIYPTIIHEFENLGKAKKLLGDKGVVVAHNYGGAFNILNWYRNFESLLMDPFTDLGFYKEMIEYFGKRSFEIYKKEVEHGADIIEIGGNLASGNVGEKFFRNFVMEYEIKHIKYIHSLGAFDIYHNCGDADSIMHIYNEMGMNAWGYLTPPPHGDVDLDKALKIMNKDMVLIGNIDQIDFMVKAHPEEVRARVKEVLDKVKPRGNFILSSTDWFFDDTPDENLKAFARAGKEFGSYG